MRDDRLGRARGDDHQRQRVSARPPAATIAAYVPRDALPNEPGASARI
jgi:hypothetical protein